MGHDYSYSQPSSSDESDRLAFFRRLEAYADEVGEEVDFRPQPECDDGIPKTCYCGSEPFFETSTTSKDPGRLYFRCVNAEDGHCHIWKWFDVAVLEELNDIQRQLRLVKDQGYETEQKVIRLEKTLSTFAKKNSGVTRWLALEVVHEELQMSSGTEMSSNLGNCMGIWNDLRDKRLHEQLKKNLIENIWNRFGNEEY